MIVVVGAGINGMAIAWRLAEAGCAVTVVERDEAGQGATWAAAGMLAPNLEAEHGEEALLPLLLESRAMWAGFARDLETASGRAVGYRDDGTLMVAIDRDDRERLEHRSAYLAPLGLAIDMLTGREARALEPGLAASVTAAIESPLDHQVDNRAVALALRATMVQAGATLLERSEALEILTESGRAAGVRLARGEIRADTVVLAAGAWSRNIAGLPAPARPPVRPVKGQMLALQMGVESPLIRRVVWGREVYLVPRGDGRLLVGATVEEAGFDSAPTAGGIHDLLRDGREVLPGIHDLPIVELWAGLRPTSRDDAPIIGPTPIPGLLMATGHHRNGILLAPITARAVANFLLSGEVEPLAVPFTIERFAAKAEAAAAP